MVTRCSGVIPGSLESFLVHWCFLINPCFFDKSVFFDKYVFFLTNPCFFDISGEIPTKTRVFLTEMSRVVKEVPVLVKEVPVVVKEVPLVFSSPRWCFHVPVGVSSSPRVFVHF